MTTPEGGMEEVLRRGLAEAVERIEPSADGLGRIRDRIGNRPPRPWLLAVGADALGTARHWVWPGHWSWHWSWAWPSAPPAPAGGALARVPRLPLPRLRRLPRPGELLRLGPVRSGRTAPRVDVGWLRPVGVLAVVALVASVSFGVQPFRQAIIQAGNTVLSSGPSPPSGSAGTDGSGSQTDNGTGSPGAGGAQSRTSGPARGADATTSRGAASARPTTSATCAATLASTAISASELTAELFARTLKGSARPSSSSSSSPTPSSSSPTPSSSSSSTPTPTPTPTPTCASPTPSVTPTPATSGGVPTTSSTPTVGDTSPTPTATPTPTDTGSDNPTATPTDTGGDNPTDSPTDPGDTGNGGTTDNGTAVPGS
jgi:hypothetical protein